MEVKILNQLKDVQVVAPGAGAWRVIGDADGFWFLSEALKYH